MASRKRSSVVAHLMRGNLIAPPAPSPEPPRNPWIGHNHGPALDDRDVFPPVTDSSGGAWHLFCWRKAYRAAWRTPPREIALRRLARAEALGMHWRDYTAIILDTGRFL